MKTPILLLIFLLLTSQVLSEQLTIQFSPSAKTDVVEGNLIVTACPKKFGNWGPGILNALDGQLECRPDVVLKSGDSLTLEMALPEGEFYLWATVDTNRNFMASGRAEPGEYLCSEVVHEKGRSEKLMLKVDRRRKPRPRRSVSWISEHMVVSEKMLEAGFTPEQSVNRFIVCLPPGYWTSDQEYPVIFVSHGFSGDRWSYYKRYKIWREEMDERPAIIVSLDCNSEYGHHVWLSSEANGPRTEVLRDEIVPYVERRYRSSGKRVVYGHSSGGWTAISLLRRAPGLFDGAVATSPDPLILAPWWMDEAKNIYTNVDGTSRTFSSVFAIEIKKMVEYEVKSRSFGQFASFLAAFSDYSSDKMPMPFDAPFNLETGKVLPDVWSTWEDNDLTLWARRVPKEANAAFSNKLVLIQGKKDEFGLAETSLEFSKTLDELGIAHKLEVVEDGGHFNFLNKPEYQRHLYRTCYDLASGQIP